ncbi:hypothetical protein CYY_000475 [Polysphondylium violaceum]|uniref:Cell cycle checkpoint protein RAD1 n=1 Tax=Polysphondylium violaceum TaxID=133409 RepID=A0A8J4Q2N7_9MYCE|nr:hypothetical protein CYY_000475 [Polysphondylium violaceum]
MSNYMNDVPMTPGASASMGTAQDTEVVAFLAKTENASDVSTVLATIYKSDPTDKVNKKTDIQAVQQFVTVKISEIGMSFIVEEGKHFQGQVFFKRSIFQEYHCQANSSAYVDHQSVVPQMPSFQFKINLAMILDCLNIFGHTPNKYTSLQFVYRGYGSPFILLLEEDGVITNCSIKTMDAEDTLSFDYAGTVANRVLIDSDNLLEAFGELDYSSSILKILLTPDIPFLKLSTNGQMGAFTMDFCKSREPGEIFESFQLNEPIRHSFQLSLIKPCIKALTIAKKTRMLLTRNGLLSFQHVVPIGTHVHTIEFYILASDLPDDMTF